MKPFLKQFVLGTCVMFTIFMTLSLPMAYYYAGLSGADTQGLTITLTPVSYTHLDVYKRQVVRRRLCLRRVQH